MNKTVFSGWLVVLTLAIVESCGSSTSTNTSTSRAPTPGVTQSTISLGLDVAQSGQAAPLTVPYVQGIQTFWDRQNATAHGVCGRTVKLVFGDNGGDPQTELTAYTAMQSKVLAMQQVSPSSGLLSLVQQFENQQVLFSSSTTVNLFTVPEYFAIGTDYGHAVLDSIYWLTKNRGLAKGDTIGILYGTGSYGTEAYLGAKFASQVYGLNLVSQQVAATDTAMGGPILSFKSAGAKYVIMVALAPQDFNAIAAAQASGYSPTWVAASFLASALTTSASSVLTSNNFLVMGNGGNVDTADLSDASPGVKVAVSAYERYFHAAPKDPAVLYGYAQADALEQIIARTCQNGGELTRANLVRTLASMKTLTTQGLLPPLNYSVHKVNVPPTTQIYLSKVDTTVLGSLKAASSYFAAPEASKLNLQGN